MREQIERRCTQIANYVVATKATVRKTAKVFKVSKSTVYKDLTERLSSIDSFLAIEAKNVLLENKSERHIRGGLATKLKYKSKSKK